MKVDVSELKDTVSDGVKKLGYVGEDARIISEVLVYAQLRGNNQGITKIATGGVPKAVDVQDFKIVKENKCGALVSGGHAMTATATAVEMAVKLAGEHGVGIVGSNHTFTSSGAIGYFSQSIAEAGFIGLVCVGTPSFVAPYGSAEPKYGTNPLSYAFPTNERSVVFDTATAAIAYFGVVEAKLNNKPLPNGVAYNSRGQVTQAASEVLDGGSVSTFAEHKGSGLALLVQLLGGPLVGASFIDSDSGEGAGTFVLAIDPGLLVDKDEYLTQATNLISQVKSAKPLPGMKVMLPGERGDTIRANAEGSGSIEIADAVWNELVAFVYEK